MITIFVILLLGYPNVLLAKTKIYGLELADRMCADESEHYNIFLLELRNLGLDYNLNYYSPMRRTRLFLNDKIACAFPANEIVLRKISSRASKPNFITSAPVDYISMVAITIDESQNIQISNDLAGKSIAIMSAFKPRNLLGNVDYARVGYANSHGDLLKLLYRKRIDVVVGLMPHFFLAAKRLNLPLPYVTGVWFFKKQPVSLVCHDTTNNRVFVQEFNQRLKQLRSTGKLRKIMGSYVNLNDGSKEYF